MADFTTWSALKTLILNEWSNNPTSFRVEEYGLQSMRVRGRSIESFKDAIAFCDEMIAIETGGITQNLARFGT